MNIGFDAKRLFLNDTGLGNYSRTLVKNLVNHFPNQKYFLFTPEIRKTSDTSFFIDHPNIKIIKYPKMVSAWWRTFGLISLLKKNNIDLYHGLSHELPFGINRSGIKSIVTIHDLIFERCPHYFPWLDRLMYKWKYRYAARNADRIIAISHNTKMDLIDLWEIPDNKIEVLYQSCNALFFNQPLSESEKEHFLYVGSIIERKRLLDIVESYGILEEKYRRKVVIVGQGKKYKKLVLHRINQLQLKKYFEFIGPLNNDQLISYYDKSIALLYPSAYEGFGIPILEAGLRKISIICSDSSSLPEVGGEFAFYCNVGDIKALSETIKKAVIREKKLGNKVEKAYVWYKEKFSSVLTAHSLINIYQKM